MLSIEGVHTFYGSIEALKGVDLHVGQGEIVALIGANGAGKSTLLMTVCGVNRARRGRITFDGADITAERTDQIVRRGVACSPEGRRIFARMSVIENLRMGALTSDPARFDDNLAAVYELFPRLKEREAQRGGTLSGGEQQMLAVGRALMLRPKIMLLDEPSFGLAPIITEELFNILGQINRDEGVSMLVVEQNANLALAISKHAYLLETGSVAMTGPADTIMNDEQVRKSYLGY